MRHTTTIPVRFGDTDMLGHVNNASYFTYMEEARVDFVSVLGVKDVPMIIASAKVDFKAQTHYPAMLEVDSWVVKLGNSSFHIATEMRLEETEQVVFSGLAVIVYFDYEKQRPARIPDDVRTRLEPYLEPEPES